MNNTIPQKNDFNGLDFARPDKRQDSLYTSRLSSFLVSILLVFLSTTFAFGTTYTYSGTGNWTATTNWSPSYPNPTTFNDTVIIGVGSAVTISSSLATNGAILFNDGTFNINSSVSFTNDWEFFNNVGGTLINNGTLNNFWSFTNAGTLTNNGTLNNSDVNNAISGNIINNGTLNNNSTMNNRSSSNQLYIGDFSGNGIFNNNVGGSINHERGGLFSATMNNDGFIDNSGQMSLSNLINNGSVDNNPVSSLKLYGGSSNNNNITVNSAVTCTNFGILTNNTGGAIDNDGTFINNGTLMNDGNLNNVALSLLWTSNDSLINNGTLTNGQNGILNMDVVTNSNSSGASSTLINNMKLTNQGAMNIKGTVQNWDTLTNNGMLFIDTGYVSLWFDPFCPLCPPYTINSGGFFNNLGILANDSTLYNNGVFINNLTVMNGINGSLENNGILINNDSLVNVLGSSLTNNDTLTNNGGLRVGTGVFPINQGVLMHNVGVLSFPDTLRNNGTLIIGSGAALKVIDSISNNGTLLINSAATLQSTLALNNNGTLINNGTVDTIFQIRNRVGANWMNLSTMTLHYFLTNDGTMTNDGTIDIGPTSTNNASFGRLTNNGVFNNNAYLNNNSSPNLFDNGELTNTGILNNNAGATIINFQIAIFSTSGTLNNDGFISNIGQLDMYGTFNNNTGGGLENDPGSTPHLYGTMNNSGTLTVNSSVTLDINGTLTNNQGGTIDNDGTLINNGSLLNEGILNNVALSLLWSSMDSLINNGTLINGQNGILNMDVVTNSNSTGASSTLINNMNLINQGAMNIKGTIQNWDTLTNNGMLFIDTGYTTIWFDPFCSQCPPDTIYSGGFLNNLGVLNNNNTLTNEGILLNDSAIYNNGVLVNNLTTTNRSNSLLENNDILKGTGSINQNGNGIITNTSTGKIAPGNSVGNLTITGDLDMGTGTYQCEIDGGVPSSDSMIISGQATLTNAKLDLNWLSNPTGPGTYTIMTFTSRVGQFANVTSVPGGNFTVNYTPTAVTVTVTGPLPISLLSFTGKNEGNTNSLNWVTASEQNNKGFNIEWSRDGQNFEWIGFVQGQGNSTVENNYSFQHKSLEEGIHYYRLKQIDLNGAFEYSKIISMNVGFENQEWEGIYPNPSKSQVLNWAYNADEKTDVSIRIIDMMGRVIQVKNAILEEGRHSLKLDFTSLAKGSYFVKFSTSDKTITEKVIIQ